MTSTTTLCLNSPDSSSVGRDDLRRYRDLLVATSDDMLRNHLFRLIAAHERRALLQQIAEQDEPALRAMEPV